MAAILDFRRPISYSFHKTMLTPNKIKNKAAKFEFGRQFEFEAQIEVASTGFLKCVIHSVQIK